MKLLVPRRLVLLCLAPWLLCCITGLQAQPQVACPPNAEVLTPQQVQSGLRDARDRGFLWRLTRDGRSSWLYGTVHAAKRDVKK